MLLLHNRNVEENYDVGVRQVRHIGAKSLSRAGEVLVAPYPVMSVYDNPTERVLLDPKRRANPFFHLFEALWMLSGSRDATLLDTYVSDFSKRFAEEGGGQHGAYGARWRSWFGTDQLNYVVGALEKDPNDRRVVISMWDTRTDLGNNVKKDLPCNTHIYPRIVDGRLDLTVCCRSNDIIWGAYGANAVHFSVLQEYLAGRIGVRIGRLYQLSNNWHAYTDVLDKVAPKEYDPICDYYRTETVWPRPMGEYWPAWDEDLKAYMEWHANLCEGSWAFDNPSSWVYKNRWFAEVAIPMAVTWWAHKQNFNKINPRLEAAEIKASDWRAAALMWLSGVKVKEDAFLNRKGPAVDYLSSE
jgi:hypothetical protein